MLRAVAEARDQNRPPPSPEIFYPTLVEALKAEKHQPNTHATQPILWAGEAYHAPQDVLVGPHVPNCFATTVPYLRGPAASVDAYHALGAFSQPQNRHWVRLFIWCHERYGADQLVPVLVEKMLREAYLRRGYDGLPPDLSDTIRCLLGRDHKLYSRQDLREGRLVEDDFPALSAALSEARANIGFADPSEGNRSFFQARLKRLTSIAAAPRLSVGAESKPPAWSVATSRADREPSRARGLPSRGRSPRPRRFAVDSNQRYLSPYCLMRSRSFRSARHRQPWRLRV